MKIKFLLFLFVSITGEINCIQVFKYFPIILQQLLNKSRQFNQTYNPNIYFRPNINLQKKFLSLPALVAARWANPNNKNFILVKLPSLEDLEKRFIQYEMQYVLEESSIVQKLAGKNLECMQIVVQVCSCNLDNISQDEKEIINLKLKIMELLLQDYPKAFEWAYKQWKILYY